MLCYFLSHNMSSAAEFSTYRNYNLFHNRALLVQISYVNYTIFRRKKKM